MGAEKSPERQKPTERRVRPRDARRAERWGGQRAKAGAVKVVRLSCSETRWSREPAPCTPTTQCCRVTCSWRCSDLGPFYSWPRTSSYILKPLVEAQATRRTAFSQLYHNGDQRVKGGVGVFSATGSAAGSICLVRGSIAVWRTRVQQQRMLLDK